MTLTRRTVMALALTLAAACGSSNSLNPSSVAAPAEPDPTTNTPNVGEVRNESSPAEEENTETNVLSSANELDPNSSNPCVVWSLSYDGVPTPDAVATLGTIEGCFDEPFKHLTPTRFTCPDGTYVYYYEGIGIGHQDGMWQARNWHGGAGATTPEDEFC